MLCLVATARLQAAIIPVQAESKEPLLSANLQVQDNYTLSASDSEGSGKDVFAVHTLSCHVCVLAVVT